MHRDDTIQNLVWQYINIYHTGIGYLSSYTTRLVAEFYLGDLTSNSISIEKTSTFIKLLVLKYCSKKFLRENTLPSSMVLHFVVQNVFPKQDIDP
jgi:hypothetical protein